MPDLFDLALANQAALEARYDGLCSQKSEAELEQLARFAGRVEQDSRVSLNMRQTPLLSFLTLGQHHNIYEWARTRVPHSTGTLEEILRGRLGPYFEARMAFDHWFVDGESFRYGALNIGGAGAARYGDFCAVVCERFFEGRRESAYLGSDSLATYLLPGFTIDEARLREDVAPHCSRHLLAAVKLHSQVCTTPEAGWPRLLCSDTDFVEAVFAGPLTPTDLESVRMLEADYELYAEFAFEDLRYGLSICDRMLTEGFVLVLQLLEARGIPLEVV
ncbi:MAG: hypothetical protein FJ291_31900 [Planctomycetes bacterium]|nr:hypothetical protein [Planctomycetota bacterium]